MRSYVNLNCRSWQMVGPSGVGRNSKGSWGTYRGIWSQLKLLETRVRLHEAWIAYPADNSWKHNSVIQALNNRTLILSAKKRAIYWIVEFGGYNLSCVVHCMDCTVIFLRLIRRISYPSFVPGPGCAKKLSPKISASW